MELYIAVKTIFLTLAMLFGIICLAGGIMLAVIFVIYFIIEYVMGSHRNQDSVYRSDIFEDLENHDYGYDSSNDDHGHHDVPTKPDDQRFAVADSVRVGTFKYKLVPIYHPSFGNKDVYKIDSCEEEVGAEHGRTHLVTSVKKFSGLLQMDGLNGFVFYRGYMYKLDGDEYRMEESILPAKLRGTLNA